MRPIDEAASGSAPWPGARTLWCPDPAAPGATALALVPDVDGGLPVVSWLGSVPRGGRGSDAPAGDTGCSLLPEHSHGWYARPGLRGHRLGGSNVGAAVDDDAPRPAAAGATAPGPPVAGRHWSPRFRTTRVRANGQSVTIEAADDEAGLALRTEVGSLPGGSLRLRHVVTNTAPDPYLLDGLDVVLPLPDRHREVLDFTGRWGRERMPQRHTVTDGLWLRENRRGKTGLDAATLVVLGTPGYDFDRGEVVGVHVAWSGNTVYRVERTSGTPLTVGGGELLLPGEVVLQAGESYTAPWVHVAASTDGLDGLAAVFHTHQRSLDAHPDTPRPVTFNVWEAVYFDHDLDRLRELADLAADVGVERYVLDDGWFRHRRDDHAGLGDWYVDEQVWPDGLTPLVDHVRARGMEFGLWFEPEMVNPDSDLYRRHPDWVLATGGRTPLLHRNQLVLDLTQPAVADYLLERMDAILSAYPISYVKWDHNRDLLEAGSLSRAGGPAVREQTLAFYRLLDTLRERHPDVEWESCASGGGRIDLGVLERVQRFWTSDMTDALARQSIQRWTTQLVAPEYLGAHVSATASHQTGRTLPLDFRAATALFGHFGIEWDLTAADAGERAALAEWVATYKANRDLLHNGRVVRVTSPDPTVWLHGVVSADRRRALMAHVQLDLSASSRPVRLRVPGLDPATRYRATWAGPAPAGDPPWRDAPGPAGTSTIPGWLLGTDGLPMPATPPHTVTLVELAAE